MGRKKTEDLVRSISKVAGGKSLGITIPKKILEDMNWTHKKKVCIKKWGSRIIIRDYDEMMLINEPCTDKSVVKEINSTGNLPA
jgi:hypothetical protein